jgi:hypothetical protein
MLKRSFRGKGWHEEGEYVIEGGFDFYRYALSPDAINRSVESQMVEFVNRLIRVE